MFIWRIWSSISMSLCLCICLFTGYIRKLLTDMTKIMWKQRQQSVCKSDLPYATVSLHSPSRAPPLKSCKGSGWALWPLQRVRADPDRQTPYGAENHAFGDRKSTINYLICVTTRILNWHCTQISKRSMVLWELLIISLNLGVSCHNATLFGQILRCRDIKTPTIVAYCVEG